MRGASLGIGAVLVDPSSSAVGATFDILNATGLYGSPFPDQSFPVLTSVDISSPLLTLFFANGGSVTESGADFVPDGSGGYLGSFRIDLASFPISNALLTGSLSPTTVQLNDGLTTETIASAFSAEILPSSGDVLQIGDSAIINANVTPEPASWALLALGLVALASIRRRHSRIVMVSVCLIGGAAACWAQVRLNPAAQPATGNAGVTVEGVTGSGFPGGSILAADVIVSIATACNGTPKATATPSVVTTIAGSMRRVSFAIPGTLPAGNYAVSVRGRTGALTSFTTAGCSSLKVNAQESFIHASSGRFMLNGFPFRFGGGNTYELMYSSHAAVDQVLQAAVNNKLSVIRTWGWIDIGGNGTPNVRGPQNGFYFQYWDGNGPAYNDSAATGLANLDYAVYKAGQLGIKLIIPFTNNWTDFGGMDQYVAWAGGQYHDQFFTIPAIRSWYKGWINHLVNHVNTITNVAYKNDPTIMMWELANEPRCLGSGTTGNGYPSSGTCSTSTITNWVSDASQYVKTVDPNHLVSVGDEGFFCKTSAPSSDWIENCSQGVDSVAFAQVPTVDAMGFHLYPEGWSQTTAWSESYVDQHVSDAKNMGKPSYLGEFGLGAGGSRNAIYRDWTDRMLTEGAAGALVWDLVGGEPGAAYAESNNSFDLADQAPLLISMSHFAQMMASNTELAFAPVADNQWATTSFNHPVTISPAANDVAYAGLAIDPSTVDLDPLMPGQQTSTSVYGGNFALSGQGVEFTPTPNFNGSSQAAYTIRDSHGNVSNVAYLLVTVKPSQAGSELLESFETGTDGWGANGSAVGTVAQSTSFATDGSHSLQVNATATGWFGVSFPAPVDLSGRPSLSIDVHTTTLGGGVAIAFQSGSSGTWCQNANWSTLPATGESTVTIPLDQAQLTCYNGPADFTQVKTVFVYLNATATYYLDNLLAAAPVNPTAPIMIESFEGGAHGWKAINGNGTAASETTFATDGSMGLQINPTGNGDWFGSNLQNTLSLSGKTRIKIDVQDLAGQSPSIAIQTGSGWNWCQSSGPTSTAAGSVSGYTLSYDVAGLSCSPAQDLTQIHAIWFYFGAGQFDLDNVRGQ